MRFCRNDHAGRSVVVVRAAFAPPRPTHGSPLPAGKLHAASWAQCPPHEIPYAQASTHCSGPVSLDMALCNLPPAYGPVRRNRRHACRLANAIARAPATARTAARPAPLFTSRYSSALSSMFGPASLCPFRALCTVICRCAPVATNRLRRLTALTRTALSSPHAPSAVGHAVPHAPNTRPLASRLLPVGTRGNRERAP